MNRRDTEDAEKGWVTAATATTASPKRYGRCLLSFAAFANCLHDLRRRHVQINAWHIQRRLVERHETDAVLLPILGLDPHLAGQQGEAALVSNSIRMRRFGPVGDINKPFSEAGDDSARRVRHPSRSGGERARPVRHSLWAGCCPLSVARCLLSAACPLTPASLPRRRLRGGRPGTPCRGRCRAPGSCLRSTRSRR